MPRIQAFNFGVAGISVVSDGIEFRVNGTCVAKLDSSGNWVIKGDLTTNEANPCA